MKTILHKSQTRGFADHGWLKSFHTFSFANYHNPARMNFGVLRVLNDDVVGGGMGFGMHRHENMEIISIPLEGELEHQDSMGNVTVIQSGDIQVMSAGTGVSHSEYNKSAEQLVKFLQIWILPNQKNLQPKYDQITLQKEKRRNEFQQIVSPNSDDEGALIHQEAWIYLADFATHFSKDYHIKKENHGVYVFVLSGKLNVAGHILQERDGLGISEANVITLHAESEAEFLIMDLPMENF